MQMTLSASPGILGNFFVRYEVFLFLYVCCEDSENESKRVYWGMKSNKEYMVHVELVHISESASIVGLPLFSRN